MDIRFRISGLDGKEIFCGLSESDISILPEVKSPSSKYLHGRVRAGVFENDKYKIIAFSNAVEYISSSRKFKMSLGLMLETTGYIESVIDESNRVKNVSTSRLIHNLTSLNAHNIQEFYSLVPQDKVSRKLGKQISFVKKIVEDDSEEAAKALLKMAKNNAAMKVEFSVFKKLFDVDPDLRAMNHNVHKVLMNVFYLFFPDFTDKDVKVVIEDDGDRFFAYFDYEAIHVALYHLIENAAKYIKPKTNLNVLLRNEGAFVCVSFDMQSTEINADEALLIFEEGISGNIARKTGKSGSGIGLSRAKKIVELNEGRLELKPHFDSAEVEMGVTFQRNVFELYLPVRK